MVEVYIQIFDEIWILSPTPVLAIFRPYQVVRKFWWKWWNLFLRIFFHWFMLGSPNSTIQELLGAADGFMIGKLDF